MIHLVERSAGAFDGNDRRSATTSGWSSLIA
jgi:hypothetical protein